MIQHRVRKTGVHLLSLFLLLWTASCKKAPPDYEARCLAGALDACFKACESGAHGKSGCLAAEKVTNPIRKTQMFARACEAKRQGACLQAAEASVLVSLNSPHQYQALLEKSCALKNPAGCQKLGDFFLADSLAKARASYQRQCEVSGNSACDRELKALMSEMTANEAACKTRYQVTACEALLRQLATRNHDAGYTAAQQVCELRGLTDYYAKSQMPFAYKLRKNRAEYQRCGLFLLARAASDPDQKSAFRRSPLPAENTPDRGGRVNLAGLDLSYPESMRPSPERIVESKSVVRAQLEARLQLAQRCYNKLLEQAASAPDVSRAAVSAHFIIDKLGNTLELRAGQNGLDLELSNCIVSAAVPEKFEGENIAGPARAQAMFKLESGH